MCSYVYKENTHVGVFVRTLVCLVSTLTFHATKWAEISKHTTPRYLQASIVMCVLLTSAHACTCVQLIFFIGKLHTHPLGLEPKTSHSFLLSWNFCACAMSLCVHMFSGDTILV
jgi:hypothetical protein